MVAGRGRGFGQPGQQRVAGLRRPEGVGRVSDRPVPGAPAQVAGQRVQVETVRPVLVLGGAGSVQLVGGRRAGPDRPSAHRGCGGRGLPPGPVVLGGHRADEARRAVAALRAAALRHLALHRVQPPDRGPAQALRGHDLLLVERRGRHQAGVDRDPAGAVWSVLARDQHRAGAALALGAAFLAARQPAAAQPLEQRDVTADLAELTSPAVDHQSGLHRTRSCLRRRRHSVGRHSVGRPAATVCRPAAVRQAHAGAFRSTTTDDSSS